MVLPLLSFGSVLQCCLLDNVRSSGSLCSSELAVEGGELLIRLQTNRCSSAYNNDTLNDKRVYRETVLAMLADQCW